MKFSKNFWTIAPHGAEICPHIPTAKIDLPFLQYQAPHPWGFLFVG